MAVKFSTTPSSGPKLEFDIKEADRVAGMMETADLSEESVKYLRDQWGKEGFQGYLKIKTPPSVWKKLEGAAEKLNKGFKKAVERFRRNALNEIEKTSANKGVEGRELSVFTPKPMRERSGAEQDESWMKWRLRSVSKLVNSVIETAKRDKKILTERVKDSLQTLLNALNKIREKSETFDPRVGNEFTNEHIGQIKGIIGRINKFFKAHGIKSAKADRNQSQSLGSSIFHLEQVYAVSKQDALKSAMKRPAAEPIEGGIEEKEAQFSNQEEMRRGTGMDNLRQSQTTQKPVLPPKPKHLVLLSERGGNDRRPSVEMGRGSVQRSGIVKEMVKEIEAKKAQFSNQEEMRRGTGKENVPPQQRRQQGGTISWSERAENAPKSLVPQNRAAEGVAKGEGQKHVKFADGVKQGDGGRMR